MSRPAEGAEPLRLVVLLLAYRQEGNAPVALREIDGVAAVTWAVRSIRANDSTSAAEIVVVATSQTSNQLYAVLEASKAAERVRVIAIAAGTPTPLHQAVTHLQSKMGYSDRSVVLVHDVARPLASPVLVERVVSACVRAAGTPVIPVLAMTETVKELDGGGHIVATLSRDSLVRVQLPQASSLIRLRRYCVSADATVSADAVYRVDPADAEFVAGDWSAMPILSAAELEFASALARSGPNWLG